MNIHFYKLAIVWTALAFVADSHAEISFNGFGSVVGGLTLDDDETLYQYSDNLTFEPDSVFALQARVDIDEKLSATVQLLAQGDQSFDVKMEWAFLTYHFDNDLWVNAGRLRIPLYLNSEFVDVGYTYHWLEPPQSVYGASPFNTLNGISLNHTRFIGNWDIHLQFTFGQDSDIEAVLGQTEISGDIEDMVAVNAEFEYNWFSARVSHLSTRATFSEPNLTALYDMLIANGLEQLADNLAIDGDVASFSTAGIGMHWQKAFIEAEIVKRGQDESPVPDSTYGYISLGYRIGQFTPHVTYEKSSSKIVSNAVSLAPTEELRAVAQNILDASLEDRSAFKIGVRYDFHPSAAFKVEYTNFDDNIVDSSDAELLAFGIDLTF